MLEGTRPVAIARSTEFILYLGADYRVVVSVHCHRCLSTITSCEGMESLIMFCEGMETLITFSRGLEAGQNAI